MPDSYIAQYMTRGVSMASSPYNDYFKKLRAIVVGIFTLQKIETFSSYIDKMTKEMLYEVIYTPSTSSNSSLLNPEPINPRLYLRHTTFNTMLNIVAGTYTTSINDPLFKRLNKWVDDFARIASNVSRELDYFPILKYQPGNKTKKVNYSKLICLCDTYSIYA